MRVLGLNPAHQALPRHIHRSACFYLESSKQQCMAPSPSLRPTPTPCLQQQRQVLQPQLAAARQHGVADRQRAVKCRKLRAGSAQNTQSFAAVRGLASACLVATGGAGDARQRRSRPRWAVAHTATAQGVKTLKTHSLQRA